MSSANEEVQRYFISFTAMSIAAIVTNPFEVVKTRLQLQNTQTAVSSSTPAQRLGMMGMFAKVYREESLGAFLKGVGPVIGRASTHGSIRASLYEPLKDALWSPPASSLQKSSNTPASPPFLVKIVAGAAAGAVAAFASNPLELLKVRAQSDMSATPVSSFTLARRLLQTEGFFSMWRGVSASMQRSALLNIGQFTVYDQIKTTIRKHVSPEAARTTSMQVLASVAAGFVTTTLINPVDVVKTRLMNQKHGPPVASATASTLVYPAPGAPLPYYHGTFDCFRSIIRHEGPRALFKGWLPIFSRQGPQTILILTITESLRKWCGIAEI